MPNKGRTRSTDVGPAVIRHGAHFQNGNFVSAIFLCATAKPISPETCVGSAGRRAPAVGEHRRRPSATRAFHEGWIEVLGAAMRDDDILRRRFEVGEELGYRLIAANFGR